MRPQDDGTGKTLDQGEVEPTVGFDAPNNEEPEDQQGPPPEETDFREQNPDFATGDEPMELPEGEDEEMPVEEDREIPGDDPEASAEEPKQDGGYSGPDERAIFEMRLEAEKRRAEAAWANHDKLSGRVGELNSKLQELQRQQRSAGMPSGGGDVAYQHPQTDPGPPPPQGDPGVQELLERQRQQDQMSEQQAVLSEYHATIRDFDAGLQKQFGVNGENTSPEARQAYEHAVKHVNTYVLERQRDLQRAAASMSPVVMRAEAHALLTEGLMDAIGQNVRRSQEQAKGLRERARRRRDLSAPPTAGAVRQRRRRSTFPSDPAEIEKLTPQELEQFYKQTGRKGF